MTGEILCPNVSDKFCPIVRIKVNPEFGRSCRFFRNVGENFKIWNVFLKLYSGYMVGMERWERVRVTVFGIFQFWVFNRVLSVT